MALKFLFLYFDQINHQHNLEIESLSTLKVLRMEDNNRIGQIMEESMRLSSIAKLSLKTNTLAESILKC